MRDGENDDLFHPGVGGDHILNFLRADLLAAAVDKLLEPAGQGETTVVVQPALVAGAEPTFDECSGVEFGVDRFVRSHDTSTPDEDLSSTVGAFVGDADLDSGARPDAADHTVPLGEAGCWLSGERAPSCRRPRAAVHRRWSPPPPAGPPPWAPSCCGRTVAFVQVIAGRWMAVHDYPIEPMTLSAADHTHLWVGDLPVLAARTAGWLIDDRVKRRARSIPDRRLSPADNGAENP